MFHESFDAPLLNFEKPTKYELTVNFRSHSKILDLANNITSIILELFPKSIDKMKK